MNIQTPVDGACDLAFCATCGLPAGRAVPGESAYCCYGCRLAAQIHGTRDDAAVDPLLLMRLGLGVFFAMNVMAFTMVLWSGDVYGPTGDHPLEAPLQGVFRWLTMLFAMPVYYLLGVPLAGNAWAGLRRGVFSMDLLLVLGVAAAFVVSLPSVARDAGPVYFEVGVAVLVFVTLGRWLEARCKQQATRSLDSLETLLPETVERSTEAGIEIVPLAGVRPGDRLVVRAGQRVPCDGMIEGHGVTLDDHLWTGESGGRVRSPGETALTGSLNLAGDLLLRVQSTGQEGSLARLIDQMRRARLSRGRYERLAERLSRVFLPATVLVALAAALVHGLTGGVDQGVLAGLAVVLIACPCALGIATPLAVWAALGTAARRGVLFQNGDVLERLAGIRAIFFDKTGTLTEGTTTVVGTCVDAGTPPGLVRYVTRGLAAASHHGLSRALVVHLGEGEGAAAPPVTTHAGLGLEATWPFEEGSQQVRVGSPRFLRDCDESPDLRLWRESAANDSLAGVAWGGVVRAWFRFAESIRPEAAGVLADLRDRGVVARILTGDHRRRGETLGRILRTPVDAELMPADKWRIVSEARAALGPVAMVGDGINDGPALAGADVGIAMGCGADVARASAGICLVGNDLAQIVFALDLANRTVRTIRLNLFWSVAYNVVGVGLACTGRLNPALAALVMVASSLFVVLNSARLATATEAPPIAPALERAEVDVA